MERNFLEEISSLSHSIVSLYFFALIIDKKAFLNNQCKGPQSKINNLLLLHSLSWSL